MSQPSLFSKLSRVLLALKYPLVLAIIAGFVWYIRNQPIPVESHSVSAGPVVRSVMGTGTLEARIRTTISPKIQGRIAEVLVDQGSVVTAGQLLVRLDDEDLAQQVRMATAGISSSEATLGRFRAEIARGRQVMELFRGVARQHGAGVIVVTHDHRTLDVFDTIYEMEDGVISITDKSTV
jgi:HlyD family secretion protein